MDAASTGNESQAASWEDRMSAMSARFGEGINFYNQIKY
jgi:hypothetical protein